MPTKDFDLADLANYDSQFEEYYDAYAEYLDEFENEEHREVRCFEECIAVKF